MAKKLEIDIIAKDKSQQALNQVQGNLNKTKSSVLNLKNALIGLGAGLAIRSVVNVGKEVESLGVRFKFLFGSVEEGALAFSNLTKFASKVPFSLEAITRASGSLAVVAEDAADLNRVLEITGNVAAVSGLDFETTAMQIQRAFSGGISAADLFRERGVNALLGFKAGATVSVEETIAKFEEVFANGGRFSGATDALAETFEGTLSMLGDKVFNFQKTIAEAGFFPELKNQFGDLNDLLEENSKEIEKLAIAIGVGLAIAVKKIADGFAFVNENLDTFVLGIKIIISLSVAKVFMGIATAILNVAKATLALAAGASALKKGFLGLVGIFASGGIAYLAFKEIDKLFEDFMLAAEDANKAFANTTFIKQWSVQLKSQMNNGTEIIKKQTKVIEAEYSKRLMSIKDSFLSEKQALGKKANEELAIIEKFLKEEKNITVKQVEELEQLKIKIKSKYMKDMNKLDDEQRKKEDDDRIEKIQKEGSVLENLKQNYAEFLEDFNEGKLVADALTETFASLTQGIGDAVAQSIVFGKSFKETFGDVARQALASLISALVQVGVQMAVNAIISAMGMKTSEESTVKSLKAIKKEAAPTAFLVSLATSGMNSIGAIAGTIATFFVTKALSGRRTGGQVTGGTPYMVGEQGKEMFVPNQSGTIVPNDRLGGGQTININIHANDTQGFDELLIKRRATIVNVINDALNSQGKEALV